jgi:hypothetical protein
MVLFLGVWTLEFSIDQINKIIHIQIWVVHIYAKVIKITIKSHGKNL